LGRFAVMAVDIFIEYQPLAVALAVGFMAPVWYLIIGALCIFAHKHLLHVARGLDDEPIEQITDLNPFQDSLALQCCLLLLIPLALIGSLGADLTLAQVIVPALIFPLLWMGVMLEGSLSEGLHPANLWRIVVGLNVFYPLAAAIISACVGLLLYTTLYWHDIFVFAGVGYLFLLGHGLAGKILYWRRGPLFLRTERSPGQLHAAEAAARYETLDQLLGELHQLCNTGRLTQAYELLDAHIDGDYEEMDPIIHERLLEFQHQRLTLRHAAHYIERLFQADRRAKAWTLLKSCVELDDGFRPIDGVTLFELTGVAGREDALLIDQLLSDFSSIYPQNELIATAKFRRARADRTARQRRGRPHRYPRDCREPSRIRR
jgi:hypothetical protein